MAKKKPTTPVRGNAYVSSVPTAVVPFDIAARRVQIANENSVKAALAEFSRLASDLRCRFVCLNGTTIDGRCFFVASHDTSTGAVGLEIHIGEARS